MNRKPLSQTPWESWTPRGPSPRVERRLFGRALPSQAPAAAAGLNWAWFVPVSSACLLLVTLFEHAQIDPNAYRGRQAQTHLAAIAVSNRAAAASVVSPGAFNRNALPAAAITRSSPEPRALELEAHALHVAPTNEPGR